jgi:hypothetical protein
MQRYLLALTIVLPALSDTGNAVCGRCHGEIARQYARTGMARSSGRTGGGGEKFGHPAVTADFRLVAGGVERRLEWFLGSGNIGHSYLFRKGGELFQAPFSYYSAPGKWDLSPGYENKPFPELTRTVETGCLQCHASRLQAAAGGGEPFLEAGISCERCHGAGDRHAARPGKQNIVNPAKLPAEQRDSVCAQCHLTGAARVARAGRERGSFAAGEKLSDSIAIFVQAGAGVSATSHFEKLAASRCRQASGEKLWCGTCHTPHADSTASHYRQQCQSCHAAGTCKGPGGADCTGCHMPKRTGERSIAHLAFTDHSIPRRGNAAERQSGAIETLKEFWTGTASARDTAMAYAIAAAGEPGLEGAAIERLRAAAAAAPRDVPLLAQFAQLQDRLGQEEQAAATYRQILQLDPGHTTAAVNLGIWQIRQGKAKEAMALWVRALAAKPSLIGARLNLAVAQYQSGDRAGARRSLLTVLDYEPEHPAARRMLAQLEP